MRFASHIDTCIAVRSTVCLSICLVIISAGCAKIAPVTGKADADLDSDNLPDAWEIANGLDAKSGAGNDGPDGDPDGDGAKNMAEYIADTHANQAGSCLKIMQVAPADGQMTLIWQGGQNARQQLQECSTLTGGSDAWKTIYTVEPATPLTNQWKSTSSAGTTFYRIKAVRP